MIEFKFSCPNCGQHIQVNDAYSGRQIGCPTCKNQIVVPPAPGAVASKSGLSVAPSPPTRPQTAAPFANPPPFTAKPKSKIKGVVVGSVVGLVLIGALAYVFVPRIFPPSAEKSGSATSGKSVTPKILSKKTKGVSGGTARSSDSPTPGAEEILQKVTAQYEALTSYSSRGNAVSIFDLSGLDPENIPGLAGKVPKDLKDSKEFKEAMSKPQKQEWEFQIKLGKPDFYRIDWEGQMGPTKNKGAVWSSGTGDFLFRASTPPKYVKMENRDLALAAATGISGGLAGSMPAIFFKTESNPLSSLTNITRTADETIDGADCYVLAGTLQGLKMILWIDKSNSLIKQKQTVLGGKAEMPEMSAEKLQQGMKQLGGKPTTEQQAQMKAVAKNMSALASQMKGTMTETYQNIEINQPLTKQDFDFVVPAGTKLSASFF